MIIHKVNDDFDDEEISGESENQEIQSLQRKIRAYDKILKENGDELFSLRQNLETANKENVRLKEEVETLLRLKEELESIKQKRSQERNPILEELNKTKKEVKEKNLEMEELSDKIKRHFIIYHFGNKPELYSKDLNVLLEFFDLEKEFKEPEKKKVNDKEFDEDSEEEEPFDEESYIKSRLCVCGGEKRWGSKGCENCRKEADANRNRLNIPMGEAWIEVWKSYGKNI